ncbi:uncharacterized protein RBU57_004972 [Macrochelys suwanniensis]
MVAEGAVASHKRQRAQGHPPGVRGVPSPSLWLSGAGTDRQHGFHVLHQQTRSSLVISLVSGSPLPVGLSHPAYYPLEASHLPVFGTCWQIVSVGPSSLTTMVLPLGGCLDALPSGPVCHQTEKKMPPILLATRPREWLAIGCLLSVVVRGSYGCLSANPADQQGPFQDPEGQGASHYDRPGLASPALVWHSWTWQWPSGPAFSESQMVAACEPRLSPPHSMDAAWLSPEQQACSTQVQHVLLESRKLSTRATYLAQWKRFFCWASEWNLSPISASLQSILDYFLHLKRKGLVFSLSKVHLAAILAFHPHVQGRSVFSHKMTLRFLKHLERLFPPFHDSVSQWDCNLVLSRLSGPPFEPSASCSLSPTFCGRSHSL